jgi:ribosomal protein S18 acetylase RimI-like enzyme
MNYQIRSGIAKEYREDAARLYAIAFEKKFEKLLGSKDEVIDILKDGINTNYAFSVISESNELLGIVGYYHNNSSLMDIKFKKLKNKYGLFSGAYKKIILSILFFKKQDNKKQLLMDGIVVNNKFRGMGIGGALITKLVEFANVNKMSTIKLDVIDHNPAKKLYIRNGFVKTNHIKNLKIVKYLIGVSGLTTMVKTLY